MSKKFTIVAALVILAATVAGGVRSRASRRHAATLKSTAASAEKYEADKIEADYGEAISTVEERYVGEIDYEKATQAAIQGMLFTLDPHSLFFPSTEFKKLKEDQSSSFYGIGVQILKNLGVRSMRLLSNNPRKLVGIEGYQLSVKEWLPLEIPASDSTRRYLTTKKNKLGHKLTSV